MAPLVVPSDYGYVLATLVAGVLYLFTLTLKVGRARKDAGVPYPYAYAEKAEAEKDEKKHIFNCTQRAHQNTLEFFPLFSSLLLVGGLVYPRIATMAGVFWLTGRYFYVRGYCSGEPDKRLPGAIGQLGLLINLINSGMAVYWLLC